MREIKKDINICAVGPGKTRYFTIPYVICEQLGFVQGDILQVRISGMYLVYNKIDKPDKMRSGRTIAHVKVIEMCQSKMVSIPKLLSDTFGKCDKYDLLIEEKTMYLKKGDERRW